MITGLCGFRGKYSVGRSLKEVGMNGLSTSEWPTVLDTKCTMHQADLIDFCSFSSLLENIEPNLVIDAAAEGDPDLIKENLDSDFSGLVLRPQNRIFDLQRLHNGLNIWSNEPLGGISCLRGTESPDVCGGILP